MKKEGCILATSQLSTAHGCLDTLDSPLGWRILDEKKMIKLSSFIHCNTDFGTTPLHFAALRKDTRFILCLLRLGLPIDSPNFFNETPLHWAVKEGHKEIVALLISKGANIGKLDSENKSPKQWAIEEDQTHLLPLLSAKSKTRNFLSSARRDPFAV